MKVRRESEKRRKKNKRRKRRKRRKSKRISTTHGKRSTSKYDQNGGRTPMKSKVMMA